jgi:hypothetical protein
MGRAFAAPVDDCGYLTSGAKLIQLAFRGRLARDGL